MPKLSNVIEELLTNKNNYLKAPDGKSFEDRIISSLRNKGFDRIIKEDDKLLEIFLKENKRKILDPLSSNIIYNTLIEKGPQYANRFIYQPFGSQNFPDILVFTEKAVIPIEDKFSSGYVTHPTWNGNLPKANSIYIFGSYGLQDITVFKGDDVLSQVERKELVEFFSTTKELELKFKNEMQAAFESKDIELKRGFSVYVRKAFNQQQTINPNAELNYFTATDRLTCEQNVITYLKELE